MDNKVSAFWLCVGLGLITSSASSACRQMHYQTGSNQLRLKSDATSTARVTEATWNGKIRDIESRLDGKKRSNWKIETVSLDQNEGLGQIRFIDSAFGWTTGKSVYRTTNSGGTWKKMEIPIPQGTQITDAFFHNHLVGWVATNSCPPDRSCDTDNSSLMRTSDGGESWQVVLERKNLTLSRIDFLDEKTGWLIGTEYRGSDGPFTPVVLRMSEDERASVEVSQGINLILRNDKDVMRSPTHDQAAEMLALGPSELIVATSRMRLFATEDGGETWKVLAYLRDEPDQTSIRRLGKNGEAYFVAGGALADDGVWGMLARQETNESWSRYRLPGVCFMDVLFLDANRILAGGAIVNESKSGARKPEGVILYSSNGGKDWSVVYRNAHIGAVSGLTKQASGRVWAVGGGEVLSFSPQ